ncbi:relaxase domain-containing protein (plasmid) [Arthrobacter sp. UC242_113]|uniref:relaxase domain-containing protein n=1 Tax=Arthrobacter sp. UC242_113 TaxID=3374550 RepID=UPI0037570E42
MTVHKLSAGDGYTYYTREVASGDELRAGDRSLGDYYTVDGNPPGQWGGGGSGPPGRHRRSHRDPDGGTFR